MPFKIFLLCLCILPARYSVAQELAPVPNPLSSSPDVALSSWVTPAIWSGEKLEYEIGWGLITVGKADMTVLKTVLTGNSTSYYIISTAKSTSFIDSFYKVRDVNESWIDSVSMASAGYSKNIREGGFFRDEWVNFNTALMTFISQTVNKEGKASVLQGPLTGPVQDMLSALYYIRTQPLEVGKDIIFDVNTKKNWPLVVKVHKREKIKTPAGKFDCFKIEPKMRDEGIFVPKGKSMIVWVTADQRHIPVLMQAEVLIGHVSARLVSHTP